MIRKLGIYIHIPFCASKCAYCNFYSVAGGGDLIPGYQAALLKHIGEYSSQLDVYRVDTVYFGGGTPGYYGSDLLDGLYGSLKKHCHIQTGAEATVEVNPGSVSREALKKLKRAGFNRISIGVQCADDELLKKIGRTHSFADAVSTVENARSAGFSNISVDIIYGLPSQDRDSWAETLEKTVALRADHISCYGLKLEEGTRLYRSRGELLLPDDDAQADMYLHAVDALGSSGYSQYEISNFARQGFESKHNLKYWRGDEYLGLGPGAHSFIGGARFSFVEDVEEYSGRVLQGQAVVASSEKVTRIDSASEYLMLRLRTTEGISLEEHSNLYGLKTDLILDLLQKYEAAGWASHNSGRWSFTPTGFLLSNTLIADILDAMQNRIPAAWVAAPVHAARKDSGMEPAE